MHGPAKSSILAQFLCQNNLLLDRIHDHKIAKARAATLFVMVEAAIDPGAALLVECKRIFAAGGA